MQLQQLCYSGVSALCYSDARRFNYAITHAKPSSSPSSSRPPASSYTQQRRKFMKLKRVVRVVQAGLAGQAAEGESFRKTSAAAAGCNHVVADHIFFSFDHNNFDININFSNGDHIFSNEQRRQLELKVSLTLQVKSGDLEQELHSEDWIANKVIMQLISEEIDPETKIGKSTQKLRLENSLRSYRSLRAIKSSGMTEIRYTVAFQVDRNFGMPGALIIQNHDSKEFYLDSCTIQLPAAADNTSCIVRFSCNSWIFNSSKYRYPRVFFSNKVHLPDDTPQGLARLRERELESLRGDGKGERREWDRVYDYDTYNDLGDPDRDVGLLRHVLGGSTERPYPRRCRTGRPHAKTDILSESPVPDCNQIYIPRDERFLTIQSSDAPAADSTSKTDQTVEDVTRPIEDQPLQELESKFFDSLHEVHGLYCPVAEDMSDHTASSKYPVPQVVAAADLAWMSDIEFARQMLAGVNPMVIQRLEVFPPKSNYDPEMQYGKETSALTAAELESQLEGITVQQAMEDKKLFVLDYYDTYMPFLDRINASNDVKSYASRTILFLTSENILKPVAIELSVPSPNKVTPVTSRVFYPSPPGKEVDWLWQLAKAHVAANDSGYHQLVNHWLRTHATLEPFIVAMHRHLSTLHPLHCFLLPHFRNTMSINAEARKILINANGVIEQGFTPGKYCMEMSSAAYKQSWRFDEQALPADLIKRGMAVPDATSSDHQLKLVIEDYPYAQDGLEIWAAIRQWVRDYIHIYYRHDKAVKFDYELQNWWTEVRTVGHGDKKDAAGWIKLETRANLEEVLTTIVWVASAHHAAVNFGQYAYLGFMPNHPTATHKPVPEKDTKEYSEFCENPEKYFLSALSEKMQTMVVLNTLEVLSTHFPDEEYLGQTKTIDWTDDKLVQSAFKTFSSRIEEIERLITQRNSNPNLRNRSGPVQLPYTLLFPTSAAGVTGMGVPNSTSI